MRSHRVRVPRRSTAGASAAVLVLATLSLTSPPGSVAEPPSGWGPPTTLSGSPVLSSPDVAVGPSGGINAAWGGGGEDVRFRRRPPSSGWLGVRSLGRGGSPSLGVDGEGTVTALWFRKRPGLIAEIVTARRPVGGTWSAPRVISRVGADE